MDYIKHLISVTVFSFCFVNINSQNKNGNRGHTETICMPGVRSVTLEHPVYLSMEPTGSSEGCDLTINLPQSHWIQIQTEQRDNRLFMKLCELTRVTYLNILKISSPFGYFGTIPECAESWTVFPSSGFLSKTPVHITFHDLKSWDNYDLILEISAVMKQATTATVIPDHILGTTTQASIISETDLDDKKRNDKSAVIIAITVILCIAIVGAGVFVAVYIYRHPIAKINELFRVSRGLRHRPRVERNIYSVAHTGVSANDVPPPYPAPRIPEALRHVGRSITGMRLPAIPPSELDNVIPGSTNQSSPDIPRDQPTDTAPTVTETSFQSEQSVQLSRTKSSVHDVALPVRLTCYPNSEDSDSDNSDDDKEEIPEHRFSMVRANSTKEKCDDNESVSVTENNENAIQYVAVDVLKEEPTASHSSDISDTDDNIIDVESPTKETDPREQFDDREKEDNQIEYTSVDIEKTLNLVEKKTDTENNEVQESFVENEQADEYV